MTATVFARGAWERHGRWRVWCADPVAVPAATWLTTVERLIASGGSLHRSKHADTYRWTRPEGEVYVKVYRRYRRWTALKDWFRPSKAANVGQVSAALASRGFHVPHVLAVGEERRGFAVQRSWCATAALDGEPLATRIAALAAGGGGTPLRAKRGLLETLGREVARLHATGVLAGDLVPANVWITVAAGDLTIAFLDHDRTRFASATTPWPQARRNLVQLNRIVLPGVTTSDRLRVYRAYASARGWKDDETRRHVPWLVAKTLARRRAERGAAIPSGADFRTVMRAGGPYARQAVGTRA
jgi:tRNA A-37 threonylcarbamoyl transferase component Bud32